MLSDYTTFLDRLFEALGRTGIDVTGLDMDHIGYQASSDADYDALKPEFATVGTFLKEDVVNGRRVSILELSEPWSYKDRSFKAVEFYAPRPDQQVSSGWEHVEFVLNEGFESFMKQYSTLSWDTSAMNSDAYAQIKLKLGDGIQVKFHLKPVLEIVKG